MHCTGGIHAAVPSSSTADICNALPWNASLCTSGCCWHSFLDVMWDLNGPGLDGQRMFGSHAMSTRSSKARSPALRLMEKCMGAEIFSDSCCNVFSEKVPLKGRTAYLETPTPGVSNSF